MAVRKPNFWIGTAVFAGLVSFAALPADAQSVRKPTTRSAKTSTRKAQTTTTTTTPARPATVARPASTTSSAARARAAAARTTAAAREVVESVAPRYKVDASGDLVPDIRAAAAIIYNPETNQVLWEENSQEERSIASITKVMTATVFLESNPDLTEHVTIERGDVFQASTTHLRLNDKVTTDDLLHLLLIASDNAAARALARVSPYGSIGFIRRMNEKAAELGLETTHYADPSGLLSENVSSAYDMARLITHAAQDPQISAIMQTPAYTVHSARREITFHSTNHLLGRTDVDVLGGKTGFISKAGYCLATLLRLPNSGQEVAVVVLGARSNAGRFNETQNLFNWLSAKASTVFATRTPIGVAQQ
jgi:D-alanyl-D-alanine endopeptidase (penicillin-binding protein 7)